MSRTVVRESIIILEINKIVIKKPGSGIFINSLDINYLSQFETNNSKKEIFEKIHSIALVRKMIETTCMIEASKIITEKQIKDIYQHENLENKLILEQYAKDKKGIVNYANLDFEIMFTKIYGNPFIINFHETINILWQKCFKELKERPFSPTIRHKEHLDIIKAIESGNEKEIKEIIIKHLFKVIDSSEKLISSEKNE